MVVAASQVRRRHECDEARAALGHHAVWFVWNTSGGVPERLSIDRARRAV